MRLPLQTHLRLTSGLLCASAAVVYLGSEAYAVPEGIFFLLALGGGIFLPSSARGRLSAGLWTVLLLALLAFEGARSWLAPGNLAYYLFEFVRWLLVAKLWTRASGRDELQVLLLSFFVLLGGAVFTYSFQLSLVLLLYVLVAPAGLLLATLAASRSQDEQERAGPGLPLRVYGLGLVAGTMIFAGGALIFFALPRLSSAIVQFDVGRADSAPVFPLELDLGRSALLSPSSRVAFRVRVEPPLDAVPLWRVMALEEFDGARWRGHNERLRPFGQAGAGVFFADRSAWQRGMGREFRFELSPIHLPGLLVPAGPVLREPPALAVFGPFIEIWLGAGARLGFSSRRYEGAAPLPLEYGVATPPEGEAASEPARLDETHRRRLLELPPELDPRVSGLARQLADSTEAEAPLALARVVERYLSENFAYSLERQAAPSDDPLSEFLFDSRAGHCEYFASAAAVLLRARGVPARVATGFAAGEWRPEEGAWVVRESDAHSWAEAYDPHLGWLIVDPSPRDLLAEHALQSSWRLGFEDWRQRAEFWWYQWVLRYSFSDQAAVVGQIAAGMAELWPGGRAPRGSDQKSALGGISIKGVLLTLAGLTALVLLAWSRLSGRGWIPYKGTPPHGTLSALLAPLYRQARRHGLSCPAGATPLGLSEAMGRALPEPAARELRAWVMAYNRARYGPWPVGEETRKELRRSWRALRPKLRQAVPSGSEGPD